MSCIEVGLNCLLLTHAFGVFLRIGWIVDHFLFVLERGLPIDQIYAVGLPIQRIDKDRQQ